jgi:hypothetical protein
VAAVVGSLLCAIHCPYVFVSDGLLAFCDWHVYTSYLVPFSVSLVSQQLVRRDTRRSGRAE